MTNEPMTSEPKRPSELRRVPQSSAGSRSKNPIAQSPNRQILIVLAALLPRLCLLTVYDVELSQDGFDAVKTLSLLQTSGAGAIPRELIDRFILHPLFMLWLYALRLVTPSALDFYLVARLASALIACGAVLLLFEWVRRAYDEKAAWAAALLLAFAPTFLWESVAILSSTLFLLLYLAVLFALTQERYELAALFAFLASITRYEGMVLFALALFVLAIRDARRKKIDRRTWTVCLGLALVVPVTLIVAGWAATGDALEFLGAQSMASIWLRFLAPGDWTRRAAFFFTQYPALFPAVVVYLGLAGAVLACVRYRHRATGLLLLTSALYLVFFEILVWLDYTTLEVRFLMYPGLPLVVFAAVLLAWLYDHLAALRWGRDLALGGEMLVLVVLSYQQADLGLRFVYNMMTSQREMAAELAQMIPPNRPTNLIAYTGTSGALDLYGRQRGLLFAFTDFRFAPDDNPDQFLLDRKIEYVIYPVGNAFARAKYPYLARFETQTHGAVTFQALTQFSTSTDNQLYSIWRVQAAQ